VKLAKFALLTLACLGLAILMAAHFEDVRAACADDDMVCDAKATHIIDQFRTWAFATYAALSLLYWWPRQRRNK
jgi:hypothetical protein